MAFRACSREANTQFGRVTFSEGGYLAGEVAGVPHPVGESEAPGGVHYLGGYSALWRPFTYEGFGVLARREDGASVTLAGFFMRGQLVSGTKVLADGTLLAGKWVDGQVNGHAANFDARGRLLYQGLYVAGMRRTDIFDHPAKGLAPPTPISTADCNDKFFPIISRRLNEHDQIDFGLIVKPDGTVFPTITRSAGMTRLDQAVLKCLATWKYAAAKRNGRAVPYYLGGSVLMRQPPMELQGFSSAIP